MIRQSPVEAVLTGIVSTLKATPTVTALATGGIYNHVPQNTPYPYVVVTSPTDRREDAFGQLGGIVLVDVKAVSQGFGDREAARLVDQCVRALDFQTPTIAEHQVLGVTWESSDRYQEVVNGIVTRHHVATFKVWTGQAA